MNEKAERWRQVSELFDRVVDMTPAQRERTLAAECAEDPTLRAEVERLLLADEQTNPLDQDIAAKACSLLLEGDPEEQNGQLFGPYRIVRLIGEGGMGRVYLAQREGDDFAQTVALKLVGGKAGFNAELARRRFVEERRILARLEHPHIARLLDGGVGPEAQPWFAMEYVDGVPLTDYCDARRLGIPARLALFAKICNAVDHAHRFLIVHRDLKPGNLLVDTRGEPKVLDFGIAKLLDDDGLSVDGSTILMTPDYAAPEQIRGGQISTATDVYSLGAVLFELLTGRRPFPDALSGREPPIASRAITENNDAPTQPAANRGTTPRVLRRLLQGDLDRIVRTALDPDPARRYRSAARLAEDLCAVATGQPISLRSDRAYRVGIFLKRHKYGVAAASIAVMALVTTTGWALWQTHQTAEHAREAVQQARIAKRESHTATSVKNLVAGLLSSASPEISLGRQLTVKEVLDNSRKTLPGQLTSEPAVAVELLTVMARSYMSLEDYSSAQALLDQAITLAPQVDVQRQAALHVVQLELSTLQNDAASSSVSVKALRILFPQLRDPGVRVEALTAVANYEFVMNKGYSESIAAPLNSARLALPRGDIRRIEAAVILAHWKATSMQGKSEERAALALLNETLAEAERYLPARHPRTTQLRKRFVMLYVMQGEALLAVDLLHRILQDDTAVFGKDSLAVADTLLWISNVEMQQGHFAKVTESAHQALAILEGNPKAQAEDRAILKQYLAQAAQANGDYAGAQKWYQAAYDEYSADSGHGGNRPHMLTKVAEMMSLRGQTGEAERLVNQILESVKAGSAAQALAWYVQGNLTRAAGDPGRALDLHQRAAAQFKLRKMSPYSSLYRLGTLLQVAIDQQTLKQNAESETTLVEIVRELDADFPSNRPDLADAYLMLGRALAARGGPQAEIRRLLVRCVELRTQFYGHGDPRTEEARAAVSALG